MPYSDPNITDTAGALGVISVGELGAALHRGCRKETELVLGKGLNFSQYDWTRFSFLKGHRGRKHLLRDEGDGMYPT